jgi:hypothetical protein
MEILFGSTKVKNITSVSNTKITLIAPAGTNAQKITINLNTLTV